MFITTTVGRLKPGQLELVEAYMADFLPRLRQVPGVEAVYHYLRPDPAEEVTIIIWRDPEAIKTYRASPFFQEAARFEQEHQIPSQREGFPLVYPAD